MEEYYYTGVNSNQLSGVKRGRLPVFPTYKVIIKEKSPTYFKKEQKPTPFFDVVNELKNGEVPKARSEKVYTISIEYCLFQNSKGIQLSFATNDKQKMLNIDIQPVQKEICVTLFHWSEDDATYIKEIPAQNSKDEQAINQVLERIYISSETECSFMIPQLNRN